MKILFSLAILLLTTFGAMAQENNTMNYDWANYGRFATANSEVNQPVLAVFMGNSITEAWAKQRPEFFTENNLLGRGIGGQTTAHMLARFQADVVAHSPRYVVILAGTNDLARNNGYVAPEHIVQNIKSMCEIARYNKITPIVCSILPVYEYDWRKELGVVADLVEQTNKMLEQYAKSSGVHYVDLHSTLKDERGGLPAKFSGDGVHINDDAYKTIEPFVLEALKRKRK